MNDINRKEIVAKLLYTNDAWIRYGNYVLHVILDDVKKLRKTARGGYTIDKTT